MSFPVGIGVTGTGAVCSAGSTVAEMWQGMIDGRPAVSAAKDPFAHMPVTILHAVADEVADVEVLGPDHAPRAGGRTAALAVTAAREALAAAHADAASPVAGRVGVVVGTGMGESGEHEGRRAGVTVGPTAWEPLFSVAATVARTLGARGPAVSVSNACAASAYAIGVGADMLAVGECDQVVVLGAESYSRVALGCFNRMGALDATACRPFAGARAGTVFGEGAAALVLERTDDARRRGATVVAELSGAAFSCDAGHPTAPDPDGTQAARIFTDALTAAEITPEDVAAVLPHGTGTELNDAVEAQVLDRAWPANTDRAPLYSLKALIGHTGGAAGALAAVAAVEIARRGVIPGNVDVGDLDAALNVTLDRSARNATGAVVVNAYAFGGNNATLVFRRAA